jgi:1-acyl-sn-glycerol-3-phosphate acyltransferase
VTQALSLPRCNVMARWIGKLLCALTGWRLVGELHPISKAVLIAAPHTSNWDIVYALMAAWSRGVSFHWLVKADHIQGRFGWLMSALNAVPVDRSGPQGLVGDVVKRFAESERMLLMVPAAGTRSKRPYWKSGFYWMAKEAGVPISLGFLDYATKRASLGPLLWPSDDLSADMDTIRAHYQGIQGKHPDKVSRIRLRAEDEGQNESATPSHPGEDGDP